MKTRFLQLFRCGLLALFLAATALAGELDPDFGVDGRASIGIGTHGDRAQAVAVLDDGSILLAGSSSDGDSLACSLTRLLPDGTPDSSFNGDGRVLLDLSDGDDEILTLTVLEDGSILAGGYTTAGGDRDFVLLRLNEDGSPDTDFGRDGVVVTSVGNSNDEITALAVERDGTLLVSGSAEGTLGRVMVLGRYRADGTLDTSFGDRGLSLVGVGQDVVAQGMVIREDGSAVVSGSYGDGETVRVVLTGFTAEGFLDTDFGENGVAVTAYGDRLSEGYGLYRSPEGDLFVAGSVGREGERDAAIFRFTDQGEPVVSFGENSALITRVSDEDDVFYSLDGNQSVLTAGGFTTTYNSRDFLLVSYQDALAQGEAGSFANPHTEIITTSFLDGDSVGYSTVLQKDGKVVTAGVTGDPENSSMAVSRYAVSGPIVPSTKSVSQSPHIRTLAPTEITATGAFTGGDISAALGTVSQRGVVFSIAPYPICDSDCAEGKIDDGGGVPDNPDNPDNPDGTEPVVTNLTDRNFTTGTGFTNDDDVVLKVQTNESATCRYSNLANRTYDQMTDQLSSINGVDHSASLGKLDASSSAYTYYVRCRDEAGNTSSSSTIISFWVTVASVTDNLKNRSGQLLVGSANALGSLLVPPAHAEETTPPTTPSNGLALGNDYITKKGYTIDGGGSGVYSSILENLTPDTRYYIRAYAIVNDTIYYGQIISFETPNACFIATAAYGSILHPAVAVLRDFRDSFLRHSELGSRFVYWYYKNSPPLAEKIAASAPARFVTRILLVPLIGVSWLLLHPQVPLVYGCLVGLTAIFLSRRRWYFSPGSVKET